MAPAVRPVVPIRRPGIALRRAPTNSELLRKTSVRLKRIAKGFAHEDAIVAGLAPASGLLVADRSCWPISRRRSAKSAKPSSPASATRAGFCLRAGYGDGGFSGATTDRPALQRLLADITAGRASAIRSGASSPTSSPTVRYWNRARQRYHRLSARYSRARVSLPTQAARPGPDNRGKPRLLDLERRIPARDRFAPDSPLEPRSTTWSPLSSPLDQGRRNYQH